MRRAVASELRRQVADMASAQAASIDDNRKLDAASVRKVFDQAGVLDIAVDQLGFACHHGVDNQRSVFDAALKRKVSPAISLRRVSA